jgi:hypothetical protein
MYTETEYPKQPSVFLGMVSSIQEAALLATLLKIAIDKLHHTDEPRCSLLT